MSSTPGWGPSGCEDADTGVDRDGDGAGDGDEVELGWVGWNCACWAPRCSHFLEAVAVLMLTILTYGMAIGRGHCFPDPVTLWGRVTGSPTSPRKSPSPRALWTTFNSRQTHPPSLIPNADWGTQLPCTALHSRTWVTGMACLTCAAMSNASRGADGDGDGNGLSF